MGKRTRFLADMGISQHTISGLCQQGFDAIHLREEGLQRLPDNEVLRKQLGKIEYY